MEKVEESYEKYEIDLIDLFKKVWNDKKVIFVGISISLFLGLLVAIFSPIEYKSEIVLMPEQPSSSGGGASSLLRQFGLGGGGISASKDLPYFDPYYFSYVLRSSYYYNSIIHQPISFSSNKVYSMYEFFNLHYKPSLFSTIKKYTIGLPSLIREGIAGKNDMINDQIIADTLQFFQFTENEKKLAKILDSRVNVVVEDLTGITTIRAEMPDPVAAAELATRVKDFLTTFSVEYATDKVRQNLQFIEIQYTSAKKEFYDAQKKLAKFRDQNRNVSTSAARTEEERLQNEYQIAYEVYLGLAQQLEQAKLKVQEETPVFSTLVPAEIPIKKSKPKRTLILVVFTFIGAFLSVILSLIRQIFRPIDQVQ